MTVKQRYYTNALCHIPKIVLELVIVQAKISKCFGWFETHDLNIVRETPNISNTSFKNETKIELQKDPSLINFSQGIFQGMKIFLQLVQTSTGSQKAHY